jgi:hypothetical protein
MSKFQATIDIVKNILSDLPKCFPAERLASVNKEIAAMEKDPSLTRDAIEDKLIAIGKEALPYVEAYKAFYKTYGEAQEHMSLRGRLSPEAAAAYDKFVADGNSVEDVRGAKKFDEFFNPDLQEEIVEAELAAHDGVHDEMNRLILNGKKEDFAALLEAQRKKFSDLADEIAAFKALAPRAEKWAAEILDKARTFELGFSGIEPLPGEIDIKKETEYYVDIMEI